MKRAVHAGQPFSFFKPDSLRCFHFPSVIIISPLLVFFTSNLISVTSKVTCSTY